MPDTDATVAVPAAETQTIAEEPSKKRPAEDSPTEGQEAKKAKVDDTISATPAVDLARVKRQVEYYFSDNNLRFDQFFHPKISEDPEGWLPVANILSCRRIQNMKASADDIISALKDSDLEIKGEGANACIRRTTPLPPLEKRPERKEDSARRGSKSPGGNKKRAVDIHGAGCIIKCTGIPEEASWQTVRDVLDTHLPSKQQQIGESSETATAAEGDIKDESGKKESEKKPRYQGQIAFASTPSQEGECKMYLNPFSGDVEFFKEKLTEITVNGAAVKVELMQDADEALAFIRGLPGVVRKRRDREMQNKKRELNSKPIQVAGAQFDSLDHLRKCLKEVLNHSDAGKTVNEKTCKVLKGMLAYHPNGVKKLQDAVGFKVDVISFQKGSQAEQSKCFFVVRSDGSCEDFSLQKCFAALSANPPFIEKIHVASASTPETAAPSQSAVNAAESGQN